MQVQALANVEVMVNKVCKILRLFRSRRILAMLGPPRGRPDRPGQRLLP